MGYGADLMDTVWVFWRVGNCVAALITICIALKWMKDQWRFFIISERVRWMSFVALLVSAAYSPLETVFLPEHNLRVPIQTVAIIWALASLNLPPRFNKENRNGRQ